MRLSNPSGRLIVALGLMVFSVSLVGGQAKAPAKAGKAPAATKEPAPRPMPAARAAAPSRRDPFEPLLSKEAKGVDIPQNLPPGKPGLVIGSLRLDGLVRAPSGMLALVTNPQQRVYFLREGDKLYNGEVERITMESVTFRERGKDVFGKSVDRQLVKRLYPSAGEQR